jgi:hypothetical protein
VAEHRHPPQRAYDPRRITNADTGFVLDEWRTQSWGYELNAPARYNGVIYNDAPGSAMVSLDRPNPRRRSPSAPAGRPAERLLGQAVAASLPLSESVPGRATKNRRLSSRNNYMLLELNTFLSVMKRPATCSGSGNGVTEGRRAICVQFWASVAGGWAVSRLRWLVSAGARIRKMGLP